MKLLPAILITLLAVSVSAVPGHRIPVGSGTVGVRVAVAKLAILIPVHYPLDAASHTYSLYGGPTLTGPWTLLRGGMTGTPGGTMDVQGYGPTGFYKIVGN